MSIVATPTDADMDHIHHALGRPITPTDTPYRNYFNCAADGEDARRFEELGLWDRNRRAPPGGGAYFHVNERGIAALWTWLEAKRTAEGKRLYFVTGDGLSSKTVLARSAGAAKYERWLDVSDFIGWRDFLKMHPRARVLERSA